MHPRRGSAKPIPGRDDALPSTALASSTAQSGDDKHSRPLFLMPLLAQVMVMGNSSVSGNRADSGAGGGIWVGGTAVSVTVSASTVASNWAGTDGGVPKLG